MIPSIFEYLPEHALALFEKVASSTSVANTDREIISPDLPAEPRVENPPPREQMPPEVKPPHPYVAGLKHVLPIGAGMALGTAAGMGIPMLAHHLRPNLIPAMDPRVLAGTGAVAGTVGGIAATILNEARQAEATSANQKYQDYISRRARDSATPTVQPPEVRT